ncbi:MAG: hypothetical protein WD894_20295 [Pirellulales bacterium]
MNTTVFPRESIDHDTRLRKPQPIAEVMAEVLARYGLPEAPHVSERAVGYPPAHSAEPITALAMA